VLNVIRRKNKLFIGLNDAVNLKTESIYKLTAFYLTIKLTNLFLSYTFEAITLVQSLPVFWSRPLSLEAAYLEIAIPGSRDPGPFFNPEIPGL